jgi:hypothetical protein
MKTVSLHPTEQAGAALFARHITGSVVMLNMLRFRDIADYSTCAELKPSTPISGRNSRARSRGTRSRSPDRPGRVLPRGSGRHGSGAAARTTTGRCPVALTGRVNKPDHLHYASPGQDCARPLSGLPAAGGPGDQSAVPFPVIFEYGGLIP